MNNIAVSVIIPVYNAERFLKECIDRVIAQTLKNIEIICVDDGSVDGSASCLEQYHDERIKIFSQENSGAGAARNLGLRMAKGEYVSFIDPDDFYTSEDALHKLYSAAVTNNALICGGNMQRLENNGKIEKDTDGFKEERFIKFREYQKCRYHQRYIIKRDMLINNRIEYPKYRRYQDPPFLARAMNCAEMIYVISDEVYTYRNNFSVNKYTKNNVKETMRGIIDLLKYSAECSLDILHVNMVYEVNEVYSKYIYRYWLFDSDDEFNSLVGQINDAINPYVLPNIFLGRNSAFETANSAKIYIDNLEKTLKEANNIIIYGAGIIGKKMSAFIAQLGLQPLGVAVTEEKENSPEAKKIDCFLEHKDDALVVVATKSKFRKEICNHLIDLEFKNILLIDQEKLGYYFLTKDI